MKTIKEVFADNLRRFRGNRTQPEMAEYAGIPFRTYQNAETGAIPQPDTLRAIAKAFGKRETELFLDPDLTHPTPEQSLAVLTDFVHGARVLSQGAQADLPPDILEILSGADPDFLDHVRTAYSSWVKQGETSALAEKAKKLHKDAK